MLFTLRRKSVGIGVRIVRCGKAHMCEDAMLQGKCHARQSVDGFPFFLSNQSSGEKRVRIYLRGSCKSAIRGVSGRRHVEQKLVTIVRVDRGVDNTRASVYSRRLCGEARQGALRKCTLSTTR